jgi:DNA-binding transcriptional MerR regulator
MDQPLQDALDIREVARRTGLTSRALRFYEARGLVKPLRTYNGRRLYGRGELQRIQQILALKRAGLTLSQIAKLTERGPLDLGALVDAQLKLIEERKAELEDARSLLLSIKSRIDRGEPVDAATFCSLIREGDRIMQPQDWKKVTDRYFSEEEMAHWAEHPPQAGFDQA